MAKTRIIFRADGNSQIGLGHVIRSLALAEMLRDDFECIFAIQAPHIALQEQINQVCHGIIHLPPCPPDEDRYTYELAAYLSEEEIVVLDGYNFKTDYQQKIKDKGCKLVCIDDIHAYPFVADVVINHAGGVSAKSYTISSNTKLYLGPEYALLRQPFLKAAKNATPHSNEYRKILINLGGADPENITLKVLIELLHIGIEENVEVIVGSSYKNLHSLQEWLKSYVGFKLHQNLSADDMCQLMSDCQIAITSPSGVAYEYCSVGGILYVLKTADNQQNICQFLLHHRLALSFAEIKANFDNNLNSKLYHEVIRQQKLFFDGKSDIRLLKLFQSLQLS